MVQTLSERLQEVMAAMSWSHADLMKHSRQSSSVVSQWLGKGAKEIKTIGKIDAAIYLERASGYSALWLAKGLMPKRVDAAPPRWMGTAEPTKTYAAPSLADAVNTIALALKSAGRPTRMAAAALLSALADEPDSATTTGAQLAALIDLEKHREAA